MSLPLTRRIARAALLVAAGAAAGVGAAGAASAAPELPAAPNLGGLTALDAASVGNTVDGAAQHVTGVAGDSGGKVVKQAAPAAQKAAGSAAGSAGGLLGGAAQTAKKGGLPTPSLPVSGLPIG
ncbi:ATP-binding protein [Streptomyces sp. NPDC056188]|uniref:ATP-binding protein n=1 Tax=Streptomyces sp. NPDC056188 TaxID=3345740 RepID=UPI0035DE5814